MSLPPADPERTPEQGEGVKLAHEAIPELVALGRRLSEAREARGLSLEALAERVRIAPGQLDALERGEQARLPQRVFVIAQARRLAEVLRVDLQAELAALGQTPRPDPARATGAPPPAPIRPRGAPCPPAAAAPRPGSTSPFPAVRRPRLPMAAAAALVAALAAALAALVLGPSLRRSRPEATSAPPAATPAPAAIAGAIQPARAASLVLRASEASWLQVRTREGRTLYEGTLQGERVFPLGEGLEVRAGRPHAVTAAVGGAPPRVLGGVNDLDWRRFTP